MKFNSFLKAFLFGFIAVFIASCDKDFNEIGADFVDNDHYDFLTQKYDVVAYNQALGPVQTNNLPLNALGYYNNPVFGKTKASFVTQLELASVNPTFLKLPQDIVVDSVYLHVPYFASVTGSDADNVNTYALDSIYGSGKIKLEVFRNNYYLRNLDPDPISGLLEQQNYFSGTSQIADIEAVTSTLSSAKLNIGVASQNNDFEFSNNVIKFLKTDTAGQIITPNVVREFLAPGIYMDLDKAIFKTAIIQAGSSNLIDNNAFKNHFRGLYFKVSSHSDNPDGAALSMLNFAQGKIVIVYKDNKSATDLAQVRKTITLNMRGITVNLLENINSATNGDYTNALSNSTPDAPTGDSRLFLKGGEGSMAIIDLFEGKKNSLSPVLNTMRSENWLINEANLVFNIDNNILGANNSSLDPNRIYLYDLNNKRPLIDYFFDSSTTIDPKFNKFVHSGIIQKASISARGTRYKIRITNHVRNLVDFGGVAKDSTNVKLGLVVIENINSFANAQLKNPFSYIDVNSNTGLPEIKTAKFVPAMSVMNPLGTVLYGSSSDVPLVNRLQLEIVYTKPD